MTDRYIAAHNLAAAFLNADWSLEPLVRCGTEACGRCGRWLRPLVRRVLAAYENQPDFRNWDALTGFLEADAGFRRAWMRYDAGLVELTRRVVWVTPVMAPTPGAPVSWGVPPLTTTTALAEWLGLRARQLDWFADCHGFEADVAPGPLRHYTYRWRAKASGKWRLLESPRPRLKAIQARVLHEILDRIPPHDAVHSYRRGRSIATFAAPHCNQRIVLRFDLRHFFASVRGSRVHALFCTAGYPPEVASLLTGLCTNVVPDDVWPTVPSLATEPIGWHEKKRFSAPHLPQGAPTSPALSNLCAHHLDCRLHSLAQSLGVVYTRYADDLAFSGGEVLELCARRFQVLVCRIALEEGFEVHTRKSRFMRQAVRQQLVGIVVNSRPNIRRDEFDRLKAILHNCRRLGPDTQNRDGHSDLRAHLLGRIAHVALLNPARGQKLREVFDGIRWEHPEASVEA